jgi:molybdenum cofactor cytidylyltransferase
MTDGIILAGGLSSRLGKNKMNIRFNDKSVIRHTIDHMQSVCHHIYVVTGFYHDEIMHEIDSIKGITVVYNAEYEKGMFSSIKVGVACTKNDFFIIPGDYPLVDSSVYKKLLLGTKGIRVPSFSFKLGHPIYFERSYRDKILQTDKPHLKAFRDQFDFEIIDVDEEGILFDIDTIEDVNKLKEEA